MKNALNSVQVQAPTRSTFDLTHDVKLTCQMGDLIPCFLAECAPGDSFRLGCETLVRLAPMLYPIMHRVDVRVEYFFCPDRLVWQNAQKWLTNGGSQPDSAGDLPAIPYVYYNADGSGTARGWNTHKIFDYLGLPDPDQCEEPTKEEKIQVVPFGVYQKIYADYYRDQNLQAQYWDEEDFPCNDGNNYANENLFVLRKRAWEADYFTKALPFAQKGEPVDIPLGSVSLDPSAVGTAQRVLLASDFTTASPNADLQSTGGDLESAAVLTPKVVIDPNGTYQVGATTIDDLNLAYKLQRWLQRNALGGTRYAEVIRAHYNVKPQDARLQRPEYIVGIKNPISISEVLNTTGTEDAPQGAMAGHGVGYNKGNYANYFCAEHGWIMGILSIMPKTGYQQGIPKHFLKYTHPTERLWPVFGQLGEQEILNKEVMAHRTGTEGEEVFGYTPRYMEYKTMPNRVAGQFRSTLNAWTMTRIFNALFPPALNSAFVTADPTQRIFAVTDPNVDQCYVQILHNVKATRALPFFGTPSMIV